MGSARQTGKSRWVWLSVAAATLVLLAVWQLDVGSGQPAPGQAEPIRAEDRADPGGVPALVPVDTPLPQDLIPLAPADGAGGIAPVEQPITVRPGAEVVALSGRVLDELGAPVAGAELRFGWHANDGQLRRPAWSDPVGASHRQQGARGVRSRDDGRFTLFVDAEPMRKQSWPRAWVVVLAEDYGALAHRTSELRQDALDLGDLILAAGSVLTARAVDASGSPLASVRLSLDALLSVRPEASRSGVRLSVEHDPATFDSVLFAVLQVVSDGQGRVRLAALPEGTARLRFEREDLATTLLPQVALLLPGPNDLGDVLLHAGGSISGSVSLSNGEPAVAGLVAAILRDDGAGRDAEQLRQARLAETDETQQGLLRTRLSTDAQGRFSLSGLSEGWYELSVTAENQAWTHVAGVPTGSQGLRILLPESGTLQLDVRDQTTGTPVPAVEASLSPPDAYGHLYGGVPWGYGVTSSTAQPGLVTVRGIGLEGALLKLTAPGYGAFLGELDPVPPGALITREIRLTPELSLSGVVMDETDAPLPNAVLALTAVADRRGMSARTDVQGRFTLRGLAPGNFLLRASAAGALGSGNVPLELRETRADIVVRLAREASVSGVVQGRNGAPTAGVLVVAWPLWDAPAFSESLVEPGVDVSSWVRTAVPTALSQQDGRYLLASMVPGRYALFATHQTGLSDDLTRLRWNGLAFEPPAHALQRSIPGGSEWLQDLSLPMTTAVSGTVRADGQPLAGAVVLLFGPVGAEPGWRKLSETFSDAFGDYELLNLDPGVRALVVRARDGAFPVTRKLELRDQAETRLDVTLAGGTLTGTVIELPGGLPAAGVTVMAYPDPTPGAAWSVATGFDAEELRLMNLSTQPTFATTLSDEQGRFVFDELPPGQVSALAQGDGLLPSWSPWRTLRLDEPLEITLEVTRGARIDIQLTLRDGTPVDSDQHGRILQLWDPVEARALGYGYLEAGATSFDGLSGGRYELQVIDEDDVVLQRETVNLTLGVRVQLHLLLDE